MADDDIASGRLARKTPTTKVMSEGMSPALARIPSTKDSGMPSSPMPSQIMIAAFCGGDMGGAGGRGHGARPPCTSIVGVWR